MRAGENFFIVIQVLGHGDQVVLSCIALADEIFLSCPRQAHIPGYQRDKDPVKGKEEAVVVSTMNRATTVEKKLTISDVGATLQFSLHRFAKPLTTSALLPINLKSPITFFRHVPIRRNMSLCSASLRISTSSSIESTSYSIDWMSGPKASVISSIRAYEIQSDVTLM